MIGQNPRVDIRDRIRQWLSEHPDESPRSISLRAGLSDSMLTKFLNPKAAGGTRSMTLETVDKVAGAMGVSARWLAYGDAPEVPTAKIVNIFDRIAERDQDRALRVLETFVEDGKDIGTA